MKCARSISQSSSAIVGRGPVPHHALLVLLDPPDRSRSPPRPARACRRERGFSPPLRNALRHLRRDHDQHQQADEQQEQEARDLAALAAGAEQAEAGGRIGAGVGRRADACCGVGRRCRLRGGSGTRTGGSGASYGSLSSRRWGSHDRERDERDRYQSNPACHVHHRLARRSRGRHPVGLGPHSSSRTGGWPHWGRMPGFSHGGLN